MKSSYLAAALAPVVLSGCLATTGSVLNPTKVAQTAVSAAKAPSSAASSAEGNPPEGVKIDRKAGIIEDESCRKAIVDRSRAGQMLASATATATNLDNSCVGVTVGTLLRGSKDIIDSKKPVTQGFARLSIPACEGSNVLKGAYTSVSGFFNKDVAQEAQIKKQACDEQTRAVLQQVVAAAGTAKTSYIKDNGIKGAAALSQVYVQVVADQDLTSYQIGGYSKTTPSVADRLSRGADSIVDNAANTAQRTANSAANKAARDAAKDATNSIFKGLGLK